MYQKLFILTENIFKVLSNHKRLEIVQLLQHGERSVTEMVEMLGISQSNLSQHLTVLRQQHMVVARRHGQNVYYDLSDPVVADICEMVRDFVKKQHVADPDMASVLAADLKSAYPIVADPVCGMRISRTEAAATAEIDEQNYYFCALGCKAKFIEQPDRYLQRHVTT